MKVTKAYLDGRSLVLDLEDRSQARLFLEEFISGRDYSIVPTRQKRSLNANAYAWALMSQIAEKVGCSVEGVYKDQIRSIGGRTAVYQMPKTAVDDFKKWFIKGHIGRDVRIIGLHENMADVLVQMGSSDYDQKQMSQLLDNIIAECRELGIETLEDQRINSLVERWESE